MRRLILATLATAALAGCGVDGAPEPPATTTSAQTPPPPPRVTVNKGTTVSTQL